MPSRVPMSLRLERCLVLELVWSRDEEAEGSKEGATEERFRWLVATLASPDRDSLAGVLPILTTRGKGGWFDSAMLLGDNALFPVAGQCCVHQPEGVYVRSCGVGGYGLGILAATVNE